MTSLNNPQHKSLAAGRWQTLTLAEQLGNIGSEFSRALNAKRQGNVERFEGSVMRFFELMDLTLVDRRWKGNRRRELARTREQAAAEFETAAPGGLQKYFDQFALVARARR
ncbi:MAG: hypothetical protein AAB871_00240 [Patescibacteria group bacterium]